MSSYIYLKCETCGHWENARKVLTYPNTDNEAVGWRLCGRGCTIKKKTMACQYHTAMPQEGGQEVVEETPAVAITRRIII